MREGWKYKKLGDVCSFKRGLTYSGKDEVEHSDNVVLRSNNVDLETFSLNFDELKYISDEIRIPADKKLRKGSLLMCMSNGSKQHLGKVAYIDQDYPYAFGGFMGLLCPNDSVISPKFLYFYCCSPTYKNFLSHIGNGANINNLKFSQLSDNLIPLPSLEVQQSIVSELDLINELIAKKKAQLKDLNSLAQSLFYEMFGDPNVNEKGWEVKKLKDVSTLLNGRAYRQPELLSTGKYKVLRVGNFFTNSTFYYSNLELEDNKYCDKGDLLFAWSASFGAFIWEGEKVIYHYHIWKVLFDNTLLDIKYYQYLLNTMTNFFMKDVHGIGMVHLTKEGMEQYMLPLPPLPLQQTFATRVEAIEEEKQKIQSSLKDLETLLASRMQYYFD